jgi:hypothetical protein
MIPGVTASMIAAAAGGGITYVGGDTDEQGGNSADLDFILPTHATDDLAMIFISADGHNNNWQTFTCSTTGWTKHRQDDSTTSRHITSAIFYKKLTSAADTDPSVQISGSQEHGGALMVFRGVDTTTPFDLTEAYTEGQNNATPTNDPITTVNDGCCLLLVHTSSEWAIDTAGLPTTPSGMTLGPNLIGDAYYTRQIVTAYKEDVGVAATYTPTAWTHTTDSSTVEYHTYTIALRKA